MPHVDSQLLFRGEEDISGRPRVETALCRQYLNPIQGQERGRFQHAVSLVFVVVIRAFC